MTTNIHGGCPKWDDSIPAERAAEFAECVGRAYAAIDRFAKRSPLKTSSPNALHWTVFHDFVPMGYYAGNYRTNDSSRPCLAQNVQIEGLQGVDFQRVELEMQSLIDRFRASLVQIELKWAFLVPTQRAKSLAPCC